LPNNTAARSPRGNGRIRELRKLEALVWVFVSMLAVCATPGVASAWSANLMRSALASNPAKETAVVPTETPVHLSAERLSFNYETNIYSAKGNVTVSQGNTRLRADSVTYDGNTGDLTAEGKVIARSGGDVIEGDKLTLKLSTATGVLFNGKLFLTRHNVFLEGRKLEKIGESTYRIERGSFTTCNGAVPDWRISGRDLDVTLEGYGTLKHGFFYIKDIPVFYIPWLVYPAKRQRQTGFLMPSLANSSSRGLDVKFPFFLNLSPSVDATITPRFCTKRAAQAALEFRYFPSEDLHGTLYGEYTYDWKYRPEGHAKTDRFYVSLRHDQEFAGQVKLKAHGSWVSDRDYFELWGTHFDRRLRVRYIESNAVLSRQWNNSLFQAEARHFDNLDVPNNAVTVQNLPIITGTLFYQQIPYTPLYIDSTAMFNHYYAPLMNDQWLGSRLQVNTRLSLPVALGPYLKLEPSMLYFAKAYDADYYKQDKSVKAVRAVRTDLYQVHAQAFTDLDAVYSAGFLGFEKIRHNIRPRVAWTYRPFAKHQTYPYFDETDRMDRASLLTAELRHTLTGRLGPREYLDFFSVRLSQGYDFSYRKPAEEFPAEQEAKPTPWTATRAEVMIKPLQLLDIAGQAEYDPVLNRTRQYSLNFGFMDHRGDLVRVLHQFTEDDKQEALNRQTNVNVQVKLTSSLECFFENQYTHQFNFSYFTGLGLSYHPQCWSITLRYSELREQDPVTHKIKEPDQTVFVTLALFGLGEVYRFSRDWTELFGHPTESPATVPADQKRR